jgi:hypothetical protein
MAYTIGIIRAYDDGQPSVVSCAIVLVETP